MIRRLDPVKDRECFIEAWLWNVSAPSWFKQSSDVFGPPTFENFIEASEEDDRATFGIFGEELDGMLILTLRGASMEADLAARPHAKFGTILDGAAWLRDAIFRDFQVREIYVWIPKKNYPTRRLCAILGFQDTGLRIIKGVYRDRVIEWRRLSVSHPQIEKADCIVA